MLDLFREAGFPAAAEAFGDRRYEPDEPGARENMKDALIHNPPKPPVKP